LRSRSQLGYGLFIMARKPSTFCRNGHLMAGDNLITHNRDGKITRECRTCANVRYRAKRKAKKRNAILMASLQQAS